MLCYVVVDDVGDHLMPEKSVLCSPYDLSVGLTLSSQLVDKCLETSVFDALSLSSPQLYQLLLNARACAFS